MKLKRTQEPETIAPMPAVGGGAVIADRFRLDIEADAASRASGASTIGAVAALVCSLLAIALVGATAWLIYQNLELIRDV